MIYHDAGLSFLHFVFAFILVGAIAAEAWVLRLPVDGRVARLLMRIDLFYAIAAVGVIVAGVSRVFFGIKGADYYASQPFFWAKMAVFAIVGLISIAPTRAFFKWNKAARADAGFTVPDAEVKGVRRFLMIEVHLLVLVPLFAALMARGVGG